MKRSVMQRHFSASVKLHFALFLYVASMMLTNVGSRSPLALKTERTFLNLRYLGRTPTMNHNLTSLIFLISASTRFICKPLVTRLSQRSLVCCSRTPSWAFQKLHAQPHIAAAAAPTSPVNLDAHKSNRAKLKMKA